MMTEAIVKVYGRSDWSGGRDVGVCFVVCEIAEIDRGTARVGSWEVSSDADSDDVDDFVPLGRICTAIVDFGFHLFRIQTSGAIC